MKGQENANKQMTRMETHYLMTNVKGIMTYLLVLYHFISATFNSTGFSFADGKPAFVKFLISVIFFVALSAVPMFVMIAGYGAKDTASCRESAFGLFFVPYVVLMLLLEILYAVLNGTLYINIFAPLMQLWFLPAMFIWMLILKDVVAIKLALPLSVAFSLISGMIANSERFMFTTGLDGFLGLSYVVAFLPFLILGYKLTQNGISAVKNAKLPYTLAAAATVIIIPIAFTILFTVNSNYKMFHLAVLKGNANYLTYFSNLNSYWQVNLSGALFRLAFMIFVIALSVLAVKFIPKKSVPFLTRVGNASMTVFCLHIFIVIPIVKFLKLSLVPMFIVAIPLAVGLCWLLSLKKVNRTYMSIMFKLADVIKVKPKKAEG